MVRNFAPKKFEPKNGKKFRAKQNNRLATHTCHCWHAVACGNHGRSDGQARMLPSPATLALTHWGRHPQHTNTAGHGRTETMHESPYPSSQFASREMAWKFSPFVGPDHQSSNPEHLLLLDLTNQCTRLYINLQVNNSSNYTTKTTTGTCARMASKRRNETRLNRFNPQAGGAVNKAVNWAVNVNF